ncbi:MAG TPA: hypothetical protein VHU81_12535 [Thermoanaerobaculia bacterium]|nr:hypothetical protein [Thermoanaerobaculia bacterium]
MRYLSSVLILKIGITIVLWFVPLLFFPVSCLERMGFPTFPSAIFLRLLGMAYGALLVGYIFGWAATRRGEYPDSTVWAGIVSNGGAFLLLAIGASQGAWADWGAPARGLMWTSLAATGLISTGLISFGPWSRSASAHRNPHKKTFE